MERLNEEQTKKLVGKDFFVKCLDGSKFRRLTLTAIDDPKSPNQFIYFEDGENKLKILSIDRIERMEEE